nr:unnamed protein product [Callosobruchus analis]
MIAYVNEREIYPDTQSGYRKRYSTSTVMIKIVDDILTACDEGKMTALVLLDFSKVFDLVNRSFLYAKFQYLNFSDSARQLIHSYVAGRKQYATIDDMKSYSLNLRKGVPEGSILGPLLFVLPHIYVKCILQRGYAALRNLYPIRLFLNVALRKKLCDSLVLRYANYGDVVYSSCLDQMAFRRLQMVQNSYVIVIYRLNRRSRCSWYVTKLGWVTVEHKRNLHKACLLQTILVNKIPSYLYEKVKYRYMQHNADARNKRTLSIIKHKTSTYVTKLSNGILSYIKNVSATNKTTRCIFFWARNRLIYEPERSS